MVQPLYRLENKPRREKEGHAGLWFDKFGDMWQGRETWSLKSTGNNKNPKLEWIQGITGGGGVGSDVAIEEFSRRIFGLVSSYKGHARVFVSCSRFVTGLGRSHPVENGFAWHPTLGTPYLPGSSVKGMVRAWAKAEGESDDDGSRVMRLLGGRGQAGSISFLDAVPIKSVKLEADVMTPHYANWTLQDHPGDWCSPTPIPFLTMAEGTKMLFSIIPVGATHSDDIQIVWNWIESALEWQGAGAKTAIGYGRFQGDSQSTRRFQFWLSKQQRDRLEKGSREWWCAQFEEMSEEEILNEVRKNLEKSQTDDPDKRKSFAKAVPVDMVQCWQMGRKKDSMTHVGKKKRKERARLVRQALGE